MVKSEKKVSMYPLTNKEVNINDFVRLMLNKTLSMFKYDNLPDSIPRVELERLLQTKGYAVIYSYKGKLYCTAGGLLGQEKSPYNQPTQAIINVPAFKINQVSKIGSECALIKNDDLKTGILPTVLKHGSLLIENDITMLLNDWNSRIQTIFSGGTEQTIQSAEEYLSKIENGDLGIVAENSFLKDLTVNNSNKQGAITFSDLIAYQQYLKSDLLNDLGLSSLNQMKKERMNATEVNANNDNVYTYTDNMLENRKEGLKMVNKLFNGNIQVDYNGSWKDKDVERPTKNNTIDKPDNTNDNQSNTNNDESNTNKKQSNTNNDDTKMNEDQSKEDKENK